jgi:hypothetical protein
MNKSFLICIASGVAGAALLLATPLASARDHVNWSVNVGVPVNAYPAYAPLYPVAPVAYQQPMPVYYSPPSYYYAPPVRVYSAPAPVVWPVYYNGYGRYGYRGQGGFYEHHHHHHDRDRDHDGWRGR